jgi:hypothetical protein
VSLELCLQQGISPWRIRDDIIIRINYRDNCVAIEYYGVHPHNLKFLGDPRLVSRERNLPLRTPSKAKSQVQIAPVASDEAKERKQLRSFGFMFRYLLPGGSLAWSVKTELWA